MSGETDFCCDNNKTVTDVMSTLLNGCYFRVRDGHRDDREYRPGIPLGTSYIMRFPVQGTRV